MAGTEHTYLAQYIKDVHSSLRKTSAIVGIDKAWRDHCDNKNVLKTYASCMEKLATLHWENSASDELSLASSRIKWSADFAYDYFVNKYYTKIRKKEIDIAERIDISIELDEQFSIPYKLLDVGSCYNPFEIYDFFDVLGIDLYPANTSVVQCDFLNVPIKEETVIINNVLKQIKENSFDIVTFCFLLEYMPSSELRIKSCESAYKLLKVGGLLIISTPDSKHVGANSKLMKCWRYSLAVMGFSRIRYEKLKHMHCMAFRKSLHKNIAERWATLHKEPYMDYSMNIPQDFNTDTESNSHTYIEVDVEDFKELPFNILY